MGVPGKYYSPNDGTDTWSESDLYRLGAVGVDPFAGGRQTISNNVTVPSGETYTFTFNMVAPSSAGTYRTEWMMVQDGVTWFGNSMAKQVVVDGSMPGKGATILSDTIPDTMIAGQTYPVTITMRNEGSEIWTAAASYLLAGWGPESGNRASIQDSWTVGSGDTYTFHFNLTAPSTTGTYVTEWKMVQENVAYFGNMLSKKIRVNT